MELLFEWLEIIGTVAFAISGAMEGMKHNMDIFGVTVLGLTTAVGGGILRDLVIGVTPPTVFRQPLCAVIAIIVSLLAFLVAHRIFGHPHLLRYGGILFFVADTVGLAVFTVLGMKSAMNGTEMGNGVLIFVGVITGIGGGVLRDLFAGNIPYIFRKHVYALASIIGTVIVILLFPFIGKNASLLLGLVMIILIRVMAALFKWNLPVPQAPIQKK